MPVITAAVIAVSAAIATTTVATVATAAVAVSAAVGVAGLAVGAVGAITGNKDLQFAGKIMGYVGMAGGLAGGVIGGLGAAMGETGATFTQGFADAYAGYSQHISDAWDKGVGSMFSGGEKVASGAENAAGSAENAATGAADVAKPAANMSSPSQGMAQFPEAENPGTSIKLPGDGVSVTPNSAPAPTPGTVTAPSAPTVSGPTAPGSPYASMNNGVASWAPGQEPASGGMVGSLSKSVSDMPDWMKYSMMTTGAQGLSGLAGGFFQGEQAKKQMAQTQQQMNWDQAQRQFLNMNANQIPTFTFNTNRS